MGEDEPVLFLRHGTRYIKAHICRVQLTSPLKSEHSEKQDKQDLKIAKITQRTI